MFCIKIKVFIIFIKVERVGKPDAVFIQIRACLLQKYLQICYLLLLISRMISSKYKEQKLKHVPIELEIIDYYRKVKTDKDSH